MKSVLDVVYAPGLMLDIYLPEGEQKAAFVYFHGGGLEAGDKKDAAVFAEYMTERGIAVISPNYRMYPAARYPEFIEDAALAVKWAFDTYPGERIFIGGSSAGAYISMMLCFDEKYLGSVGISPLDISGFIHDAGQPTAHFTVLENRGIDPRRIIVDESAPLYYIGRAEKYAPMAFIVSDNDLENRYEQTMLTISTLKHFRYDENKILYTLMKNSRHCSYVNKIDEHGQSVFAKVCEQFINEFMRLS